ncbi:MAG TPA: polysaccharide biosynthesis protein [Candidatus Fimihabitans intestinipullorum]|uniref:Polysaccharide biosynthesis protein n=1 Tax=Candidatus Fimihabitans intestinipullorum TaxID=2840820 RepID=A0A9D1HV72_9BACT|nr:polysaccharide biosynthesis protein [Candidatus Fimihabitans intestinipullorum]
MKKNTFLEGAMIATIGIILCKIIGLVYVIPFYAIIGTQGGALYSYAYSIYAIFLSLSNSGIPVAVSKVISEYNTLGYVKAKERAFQMASIVIIGLGIFFFLVLVIFAPTIASVILGDIQGGNTLEGVTLVIRVVATALLIVPIESVTQGYFQGHKIMVPPTMANVIEQLVRVIVIVAGSFVALQVFHLSLETAVGIAVFGATIGCLVAYFYLLRVLKKNKKKIEETALVASHEPRISRKTILKKIIYYALPFVMIDVMNSAYGMVDTLTVVSGLTDLGYDAVTTETAIGVIATWATKLNMIVASIALGITVSLIPNIASSYVKKNWKGVSRKMNQALQALSLTTIPMAFGLSFLAAPVWVIFYGYNALSIDIFRLYILQAITFSFYTTLVNLIQTMNRTKLGMGILGGSFIAKYLLNVPIMKLCYSIGIPAYYGPIFTTLLTQSVSVLLILIIMRKDYQVAYRKTIVLTIKVLLITGVMLGILSIMNLFIPVVVQSRWMAILITILYAGVGAIIYCVLGYRHHVFQEVFGNDILERILRKIHLKKA